MSQACRFGGLPGSPPDWRRAGGLRRCESRVGDGERGGQPQGLPLQEHRVVAHGPSCGACLASVDSVGCRGRRQIVGAWVACGAADDALVTVNGEGNHKDWPYKHTVNHRKVPRADFDGSCRGSSWSQSQKSGFGGMPEPPPDRGRVGDGAILGLMRQAPCGCPFRVRRHRRHSDAARCETGSKGRPYTDIVFQGKVLRVDRHRCFATRGRLDALLRSGGSGRPAQWPA